MLKLQDLFFSTSCCFLKFAVTYSDFSNGCLINHIQLIFVAIISNWNLSAKNACFLSRPNI